MPRDKSYGGGAVYLNSMRTKVAFRSGNSLLLFVATHVISVHMDLQQNTKLAYKFYKWQTRKRSSLPGDVSTLTAKSNGASSFAGKPMRMLVHLTCVPEDN